LLTSELFALRVFENGSKLSLVTKTVTRDGAHSTPLQDQGTLYLPARRAQRSPILEGL
jgi:hypothetical protein